MQVRRPLARVSVEFEVSPTAQWNQVALSRLGATVVCGIRTGWSPEGLQAWKWACFRSFLNHETGEQSSPTTGLAGYCVRVCDVSELGPARKRSSFSRPLHRILARELVGECGASPQVRTGAWAGCRRLADEIPVD